MPDQRIPLSPLTFVKLYIKALCRDLCYVTTLHGSRFTDQVSVTIRRRFTKDTVELTFHNEAEALAWLDRSIFGEHYIPR